MVREQAIATDGMWAGYIRTAAAMVSGWHHHGAYETTIYVLSSELRMEFGPAGGGTVQAGPGDFVYVAPGTIHPESNPTDIESHILVVRSGTGEPVMSLPVSGGMSQLAWGVFTGRTRSGPLTATELGQSGSGETTRVPPPLAKATTGPYEANSWLKYPTGSRT
jgi:uncharacterized RmlC-like cupin family protein